MAAAKGRTNGFAIGISIAVVVVLVALGGVVVWLNNKATDPGTAPTSSIVDKDNGGITIGSGKTTVETYVDFMCPICGQFEKQFGEQLQTGAKNGDFTLKIHPIAILDGQSQGTNFSTRSANAMYCVADKAPDKILDFFNGMFAKQPEEGSTGLTDAELVQIAKDAGAGDAEKCITGGEFSKYVTSQTTKTPPDPKTGQIGTPTVVIDGKRLNLQTEIGELTKLLK